VSLNKNEIEVIEFLTGSYGLDYEFAKEIAKMTYGDLRKAEAAADAFKVGRWSREQVLDSIRSLR
jgi:hypothetical protein